MKKQDCVCTSSDAMYRFAEIVCQMRNELSKLSSEPSKLAVMLGSNYDSPRRTDLNDASGKIGKTLSEELHALEVLERVTKEKADFIKRTFEEEKQ